MRLIRVRTSKDDHVLTAEELPFLVSCLHRADSAARAATVICAALADDAWDTVELTADDETAVADALETMSEGEAQLYPGLHWLRILLHDRRTPAAVS